MTADTPADDTTVDQNRLARLCRNTRILALTMMAGIPILIIWYWIDPLAFPIGQNDIVTQFQGDQPLPGSKRIAGFAITMMAASALMIGILGIYRLAGHFMTGQFISVGSIRALRLAAIGFITFSILNTLQRTLLILLLTFDRPEGERLLAIGIDGGDVVALLVGLMLLALSRVFIVEQQRAEDQALIV